MPNYTSNMKKNAAKHIENLEKLPENIKSLIVDYEKITLCLKDLNTLTDKQYTKDGYGLYKNMDKETFDKFEDSYSKFAAACQKYLDSDASKQKDMEQVTNIIEEMANDASADMKALESYRNYKEPVTFQMIMDRARVQTVDLTSQKNVQTLGAAQSSRIPFRYEAPDGHEIAGVFTKKTVINVQQRFQDGMKRISKEYPEHAQFVKDLFSEYQKNAGDLKDNALIVGFVQAVRGNDYAPDAGSYLHDMIENFEHSEPRDTRALKEYISGNNDDPDFKEFLQDFFKECAQQAISYGINIRRTQISNMSRLDSRNSAMSAVADMLGVSNVIAKSTPMKVKMNGEIVEGTFMELANGMDISKPTDACFNYDTSTFETNGLKSVSDLMFLDYICGNTDRHVGNIMYQFDTTTNPHKFAGVQGIDNDTSFGTRVPSDFDFLLSKKDTGDWLPRLNSIKVISASTANAIKGLTPDMLKFKLRGFELTKEQIDAAAARLNQVKTLIETGEKYWANEANKSEIRNNPGVVDSGHVRVVPDDQFEKFSLKELTNPGDRNTYKILSEFRSNLYLDERGRQALNPDYAERQFGVTVKTSYAKSCLKRMADVTKPNKSSDEFEALRELVTSYSDFCKSAEYGMLTTIDCKKNNEYLQKIVDASKAYLAHKKHSIYTTDYAQSRIDLVKEMQKEWIKQLAQGKKHMDFVDNLDKYDDMTKGTYHDYEERATDSFNQKMREEAEKIRIQQEKNDQSIMF